MLSSQLQSDIARHRQQVLSQEIKVVQRLATRVESDGFFPWHVRSLPTAAATPIPFYIKTVTRESQEVRYLPFVAPGEQVAPDWLRHLQNLGIAYIYLPKDHLNQGLQFLHNCLNQVEAAQAASPQQKLAVFYDHLHLSLMGAMTTSQLAVHLPRVVQQVEVMTRKLETERLPFHLVWETLLKDYSLYKHSLNVFLISLAFMVYLKHRKADCHSLGMAALFHDVGLLKLPEALLLKTEALSLVEQADLKRHPQIGHDTLSRQPGFPGMALRLVLEHHENADGSGYPHNLDLRRQHPFTRILRMVDGYESLTTARGGQPGITPFEALQQMKNDRGRLGLVYDFDLLNKFIRFIGT